VHLVDSLRRGGGVAAVALALALVLAFPPGSARAAVVTPPAPVGAPGSVLSGTGGYKTPGQWDVELKAPQQSGKPYTVPGPSSPTGAGKIGVSAGAGAVAGIVGLQFGLEAGSQIAYAVGISETGSWSCDLRVALGGDCGVTAGGAYVPNSDLGTLNTSGWTALPVVDLPAQEFMSGSGQEVVTEIVRWSFDWIVEPETMAGAGSAEWQWAASAVFPGYWFAARYEMQSRAFCHRASDGLVSLSSRLLASGSTPMEWNWAGSQSSGVCGNGDLVERVELWVQDAMDLSYRVVATWYPQGHALRPEIAPDPARWWRTSWLCESGTGGFALSEAFRESDPEWPGFPQAQCDGSALARVVVEQLTEGATEGQVIFEWEADPAFREWTDSECARSSSPCYLDLQRVISGTAVSCFSDPEACAAWWAESQAGTNTSTYRCVYGGTTVDLRECAVYARAFDWGVYADPATGEAVQRDPSTEPNPKPDPDPLPEPEPQPEPAPEVTGPPQSDGCPPPFSWTSLFNPWWYYKSTTCALEEAFVPRQSTAHLARINAAMGQTTVALWAAEVDGMFDAPPAASGCQGPVMTIDAFGLNRTLLPFSACDAPMSTAAPWVRGVATGLVVVFGSMACVRALGAGFGWKPSAGGDS
jgi:hypothetical protein